MQNQSCLFHPYQRTVSEEHGETAKLMKFSRRKSSEGTLGEVTPLSRALRKTLVRLYVSPTRNCGFFTHERDCPNPTGSFSLG